MVVPSDISDFEIMPTPPNNVNIPKKVISPVAQEIQKLRKRRSSGLEIVDHLLEIDGLTKPITPKYSVKENSIKFTTQG